MEVTKDPLHHHFGGVSHPKILNYKLVKENDLTFG